MGPGPTPTHIYNGEKSQQIFGIERERERAGRRWGWTKNLARHNDRNALLTDSQCLGPYKRGLQTF